MKRKEIGVNIIIILLLIAVFFLVRNLKNELKTVFRF